MRCSARRTTDRSLFAALLDARDRMARGTLIAEDIQRAPISYDRLVVGFGGTGPRAGRRRRRGKRMSALLMPNAVASLVAFMGLQAFGACPAC